MNPKIVEKTFRTAFEKNIDLIHRGKAMLRVTCDTMQVHHCIES